MLAPEKLEIMDYLNTTYSCECKREHSVPIKHIVIKEDALLTLPEILSSFGFRKSFILFDSTTYLVAGDLVQNILKQSNLAYSSYILKDKEPTPDERTIGEVLINYDPACDHMIAVGSGTLNDLSRFISYKLQLPYMIVATAPSMDGFASTVAPLIVKHMKITYEAQAPFAILGDTNLLQTSPLPMIAAGIGDILGKYSCLCDWKIAHVITSEYHCEAIEQIVKQSLDKLLANIDKAKAKEAAALNSIMEALVLSGIAMSFAGNSRPASGSEHHLSHYWEMIFLFEGKRPILHGAKVGIGTIAVIKAYELLMKRRIYFTKAVKLAESYSRQDWEMHMKSAYKEASGAVIELEFEIGKNEPSNVIRRLKLLEQNWNKLEAITTQLPSADYIRNLLRSLEAPSNPMSVGIDKDTFINSFWVAKELRNRFGLLQILFDLGLTQEIAEEVWDYFQIE